MLLTRREKVIVMPTPSTASNILTAELHRALANYYCRRAGDLVKAREAADRGLAQSRQIGDEQQQAKTLHTILLLTIMVGNPVEGI
jgi:hypothetical protein